MTVGIFAALILVCCGAVWFVGIPRLRDNIADSLSEELSTQVAAQLDGVPASAGTYTLDVADLETQLQTQLNTQNVDDIEISVDSTGMNFSFTSSEQEIGYTGRPVAEDGRLQLEDMEVNNDVLGFIMPADTLGNAIEEGVNNYFAAQDLAIESIALGDDVITFEVVPA